MSTYSYAQLEGAWIGAGGPSSVAPTMAAIAEAESGGSDIVQQGQPYSQTGWGVWQITPGNSVPSVGVDNALLNLTSNARAAVAKYNVQGLGAWTTYTTNTYQSYMQSGVTPATDITSTSQSVLGPSALDTLMKALNIPDPKELLQRAGLIVFGGLLIIVGMINLTGQTHNVIAVAKKGAVE